jgi:hypothetical protein
MLVKRAKRVFVIEVSALWTLRGKRMRSHSEKSLLSHSYFLDNARESSLRYALSYREKKTRKMKGKPKVNARTASKATLRREH